MALFASPFGQELSKQQEFYSLSNNQLNSIYTPSVAMKRKKPEEYLDEPGAKRKHYEDRMAYRLNSLDISNENIQQNNYFEDDFIVEEIDPEILTDKPQSNTNEDSNIEQPIVEEPDEDSDNDKDESNGFKLDSGLKNYMKNNKPYHIFDKFVPKTTGRELVLWRPPPIDADKLDGQPTIQELDDGDVEISEYSEPIPLPYTQKQVDETRFLNAPHGTITFPIDDSTSSSNRSSTSPPLGVKGYRQTPNFPSNAAANVLPVDEEPMDVN